jgi:hypothetical protein
VDALVGQPLPNGMHRIPERHTVAQNAAGMRIQPRPNRRARRRADRLAVVGSIETDSSRGDAIKVWRLQACLPITVQHIVANRLAQDDDRLPWGWCGTMRKYRRCRLRGAVNTGRAEKSQKVSAINHERAFAMSQILIAGWAN